MGRYAFKKYGESHLLPIPLSKMARLSINQWLRWWWWWRWWHMKSVTHTHARLARTHIEKSFNVKSIHLSYKSLVRSEQLESTLGHGHSVRHNLSSETIQCQKFRMNIWIENRIEIILLNDCFFQHFFLKKWTHAIVRKLPQTSDVNRSDDKRESFVLCMAMECVRCVRTLRCVHVSCGNYHFPFLASCTRLSIICTTMSCVRGRT